MGLEVSSTKELSHCKCLERKAVAAKEGITNYPTPCLLHLYLLALEENSCSI